MIKSTSIKLNDLTRKVYNLSRKNKKERILFWVFLDSNRLNNYSHFLNSIPTSKNIGIIMRSKSIKGYYNHAKILMKICRKKKFTFLISTHYNIAKAIGADGVHYPDKIYYTRKDKSIFTSCSYHGQNDYKRATQLSVDLVFISPIFKTKSNRKKKAIGLTKICLLANNLKCQYSVLGGVSSKNIKSLRNRDIVSISGLDFICEIIESKC